MVVDEEESSIPSRLRVYTKLLECVDDKEWAESNEAHPQAL